MEVTVVMVLVTVARGEEWSEWPEAGRSGPRPDFVFPDQLPRLRKMLPNIAAGPQPRGCGDADFCEIVSEYPDAGQLRSSLRAGLPGRERELLFPPLGEREEGEVRARLAGLPPPKGRLKSFLGEGEDDEEGDGKERGYFSQESPACDSQHSFVYPRTARNRAREWRFVINVPGEEAGQENYVQAVKVERCLRQGETCNIAASGYDTTVCRQKYSWRRLLALGQDGEQYVDSFRFPSCCVCFSKKTFHHNFALLRTTAADNNNTLSNTSSNPLLGSMFEAQSEVTTPRSRRWPMRANSLLAGGASPANRETWRRASSLLAGVGSQASRETGRRRAGCSNSFCRRMVEGRRRQRRIRRLRR